MSGRLLVTGAYLSLFACGNNPSVSDAGRTDASTDARAGDGGRVDRSTFVDPPSWSPDTSGVYQLRLAATAITLDGQRLCLRAYNGAVPGPMLRIPASASPRRVRIDLENALQRVDDQIAGPSVHYDFNSTNLHTHGLHVQPNRSADGMFLGDNVLVHHHFGQRAQYRFDIDEDGTHDAGTFWYHPHLHGSTSVQVANGVAGAMIVEGPVDRLPGIAQARERVFVLQHIPTELARPFAPNTPCDDTHLSLNTFVPFPLSPRVTFVNGVVRPRIVVPPRQVERWRLIHAGVEQTMNLGLYRSSDRDCGSMETSPLTVQQIATDGITYPARRARRTVNIVPGNRADIMVEAPATEGVYCMTYPRTDMLGRTAPQVVAILEVDAAAGAPTGAMPSDADLARVARPLMDCSAPPDGTQRLVFSQQRDPATGMACDGVPPMGGLAFNINCRTFDENRARVLGLGRTEDWNVSSENNDHPMHIHVNPFMVCEGMLEGERLEPHWRDTLLVRQADGAVRLRMHYQYFTGSFVTHCHKLHHEDQGMMELIEIRR